MYANTAYEALYEIMGLQFQEEVTRWITSQVIFRALILVIFGVAFFTFLLSLASRYIPFFLPSRRAPIAKLVLLVFCLFVGISLLKVDVTTGAANMAGASWAQNPYITNNAPSVRDQYRVSMIFRLLSGAAEEIARALGAVVDGTFSKTHSQMQAPNFFYKALLGSAFDTIDDPKLRSEVEFYTSECLSKALPRFNPDTDSHFLDRYFSRESTADRELAQIQFEHFLNKVIVTPRMHGIHHSIVQNETDSDYSTIFSFWDRLHRTIRLNIPQAEITVGVAAYRDPRELGFFATLWLPFRRQRDWKLPDGTYPQRPKAMSSRQQLAR